MSIFKFQQKHDLTKKVDKKKKKPDKKLGEKIDRELPYVITLVTIMAASGITPFGSFAKLARYKLLPFVMRESRNIIGQVHILGVDPLTAMEKRAEATASKQYRDLLLGYVSTVRNGGDIASFLQSKMKSIFEFEVAVARQSVAKIGGLVDAYMIMQVIALSMYVVVVALSSSAGTSSDLLPASMSSPMFSYMLVFVILPAISIAILYALDKTLTSTLIGVKSFLKQGLIFSFGAIVAFVVLTATGVMGSILDPVYAFPLFLMAASALPAYKAMKAEKNMRSMENELPSYLRDVAESRKAGLSPEKCIIYASERLRDPVFHRVVKTFANQLEWGVPLRKIYTNLASTIKSWSALIHFRILIEAIDSGGGYTTSLEILAQSSESSYNTEQEKNSMLKPYVFIAFMVTALTSLTTLMIAQTFTDVNEGIFTGPEGGAQAPVVAADQGPLTSNQMFAIGIAAQSWMTGFLVGKISSGSFGTGFKHGIILLAISMMATIMTQEFNISPSMFMGSSEPAV
ncbi:MAG TPA: type II secretion system F family protein [Nitrososphaera sp.]|nr:type II secretion system F family protein [Nitrososphaera sp.]